MTEHKHVSRRTTPLTIEQVLRLPSTVDLITAARALRVSRNKAYELAGADAFPCRVIRIGELWRVPTAELLGVLGIDLAAARALKLPPAGGPTAGASSYDDA